MTAPAGNRQPKDAAKYLLPGEQLVVSTRRHPAVLALPALRAFPLLVAGVWLISAADGNRLLVGTGLVLLVGSLGWFGLAVGEWWIRHFLISRRRVMLISGFVVRTVAVMPLRRITDMTWQETPVGQVLGYGTFRFESAGQDQALSEVTYLPNAGQLYRAVSQLLFGEDWRTNTGGDEDGDQAPARPRSPVAGAGRAAEDAGRGHDTRPIPRLPPERW